MSSGARLVGNIPLINIPNYSVFQGSQQAVQLGVGLPIPAATINPNGHGQVGIQDQH